MAFSVCSFLILASGFYECTMLIFCFNMFRRDLVHDPGVQVSFLGAILEGFLWRMFYLPPILPLVGLRK